ncbi:MAG: histidine phosphatase family protein [Pseudomonadota bacterium]
MTTIYLIRHGQASIGTSNYDMLSANGRNQSRILGEHLARLNLSFDRIVSGTLKRQTDTAIIATGCSEDELLQNPAFNEYQHSQIFDHYAAKLATDNNVIAASFAKGHNEKLTYEVFAILMNAWAQDNDTHGALESWDDFTARIRQGLTDVITEANGAEHVAIFTSGGVICTILQMIIGFPIDKIFEINWGIYNAGISALKVHGTSLKLSYYNNITHLQLKNDQSLITNI